MKPSDTVDDRVKSVIAGRFGRSVDYYRQHAGVQQEVAERLMASLEPWKESLPPGPVLEVGCGTGFVTEELARLFPGRRLEITDLAPEMVDYCRERFGADERFDFRVLDAEQLDTPEKRYGLAVTGFTAQWFRDPARTLGRMLESVQPGGLLLASFPGSESFPEWKAHCRELGLPFTGNTLPDTEEVVVKLSTGPTQVDFYEDTVTERYPDAASFFRHLKRMGAGTRTGTGGRSLTARELRLLMRQWDAAADGALTVSYHVVFLAVKRDFNS